jgi:ATP-binding cassette subfamily F protein 3
MPLPLLEGQHLRKRYGLQTVLEDLSFLITEKQKIALIGRNGAGKSTLLKLITGVEEADGGKVVLHANTRLGIVKQHEELPDDVSGLDYLVERSGKAEWEVQKLGASFGLTQEMLSKPPDALSGGYQMRVKLTLMLLGDPNLLILDEPVNYLDLQTLLLLEQFLQSFQGSFIIAAHDRTFLQNTCTHTFEIERGVLTSYAGGVQEYFAYKKEQHELQVRSNKKLKREIAHHQTFVDRFRYKRSLASRAQSKMKHIAKLRRQIVGIDADLATTRIKISSPRVVPGPAVRADALNIGYGDFVVAENVEFEIQRGQKVVIAGENGRGKSTLLKTIAGTIPALGGSFKWWHRADIGYYDQMTSASLDSSETVLKHLTRMAPGHVSGEGILMMAGNFLFTGDDLDKPVSVLSGGERARLALAGILLKEHNVLLLDEPTNHLDVETTEALALALKEYKGTVVFVSHARTFVNALADEIYEMRAGRLRRYMGTYEEYVEDLEQVLDIEVPGVDEVTGEDRARADRAELHTRIKEHQRSQQRVDRSMKTLDAERSNILAYFFENPTDYAPVKAQRLEELNQEMESLEAKWLEDEEMISSLRDEIEKTRG